LYKAATEKKPFEVRVEILDPQGLYLLWSQSTMIAPSGEVAKLFAPSKPH
jgi:hypothetical protein